MSRTKTLPTSVLEREKHQGDYEFEYALEHDIAEIERAEENLRNLASDKQVKGIVKLQWGQDNENYERDDDEKSNKKDKPITVNKQKLDMSNSIDLVALSRYNYKKFLSRYDATFE